MTRQALPPITLACFLQSLVTIDNRQKVLPRGLAVPKTAPHADFTASTADPQHFDASQCLKKIPGSGAAPRRANSASAKCDRSRSRRSLIQQRALPVWTALGMRRVRSSPQDRAFAKPEAPRPGRATPKSKPSKQKCVRRYCESPCVDDGHRAASFEDQSGLPSIGHPPGEPPAPANP